MSAAHEQLAACCGPSVRSWEPSQLQKPAVRLNEGVPVRALSWSNNNKVLAVAGDKSEISMYTSGSTVPLGPGIMLNGVDSVTCLHLGSKKLVAGCSDNTVQIVDLRNGVRVSMLMGPQLSPQRHTHATAMHCQNSLRCLRVDRACC
jgi:WD40 repeat protein